MNLELATVDELIDELGKRFESFALVGQMTPTNEDPDERRMAWRHKGNKFLVLGLLMNHVNHINGIIEEHIERWEPKSDDL